MHGTSHHMGLDTHDYGILTEPMQAGMVFTVEPGIYLPEENPEAGPDTAFSVSSIPAHRPKP